MNRLAVAGDLPEDAIGAHKRELPGLVAAMVVPDEKAERGLGDGKGAVLAGCEAHREAVSTVEAVGLVEAGHVGGEVEAALRGRCWPVCAGDGEELFRAWRCHGEQATYPRLGNTCGK